MLELENVVFRYSRRAEPVLRGVSLTLNDGEIGILLGKNGAGKTTLFQCILGLAAPESGSIRFDGGDLLKMPRRERAKLVAYVPQHIHFGALSVFDSILLGRVSRFGMQPGREDIEAAEHILTEMHLEPLADRSAEELSGGEKQKIAFSSVYASAPDVLVFDEPSSNLDMKAIGELADLIQQAKISGKTILIAEHRIWYLMDIVDRVVYMQDGRIASDMEASAFKALPEADIRRMGLRVRDLSVSESGGVKTIAADGLLSAQKISVRLGGRNVMNDISFQASRGEIIAIAGVNGAGKSTLARMLCGLQKNGSGTVLWTGKPMSRRFRRKKAYMVMQDVGHQLFTDSVAAECALGIKAPNKDEIDRTLEKVDLLAYKERHPLSLSGGQMQRLAVVVSDICGKELLVFDEPTSGLDLKSMEEVGILTRSLATQGKVLLIITHDIEFMMRICTRILFIRDGEIMKDLSGGQKEKIVRLLRGEE